MKYDKPEAEIIDFEKDFVLANPFPIPTPEPEPLEPNPYPGTRL